MITLQRKYKVLKARSLKDLEERVNEEIQREFKDTEGFIFRSSGRWQCLGGLLREGEEWFQTMVFTQEEE